MSEKIDRAGPTRWHRLRWLLMAILLISGGYWWFIARTKHDSGQPPTISSLPAVPTGGAVATPSTTDPNIHPLVPVLELASQLMADMKTNVRDYTARVIKRERIRGKLGEEEFMHLKIRHEDRTANPPIPFSVYLIYVPPSGNAGREAIWVKGANDNKLITHELGVQFKLPPKGLLAMMNSRYPIYDIGMLNLAEKLIEKGSRDKVHDQCQVEIYENQLIDQRACKLIQVKHPEQKEGLEYHIAQIYIDNELHVPIRYAAYSWPTEVGGQPKLEEEYTYLDLKLNVGLTDLDFDPKHPDYKYPK